MGRTGTQDVFPGPSLYVVDSQCRPRWAVVLCAGLDLGLEIWEKS